MDESILQTHLTKLAQQTPPPSRKKTARDLVERYYDDIIDLVTQGWEWDDIAQGFQGKKGALKGETVRKYFYEHQRNLEKNKQQRRAKRKKSSTEKPDDKPDNPTFRDLIDS